MSMVWLPLGWHTRRLRRIRADWAKPLQHSRNLKAMAETHASRLAAIRDQRSLDDRTWADLNLDEVFVALDRTSSTLGQHALYHRMRSGPPGEGLEEFEALVERLRADPAMRERAQLALARLQEPHGYDVWWLGQPDAVEAPRWYGIFPLLTAGALVSIALAPLWPGMLLAMLAINLFVRYRVDRRINALSVSIRHCAPLLRAARTLGDLTRNSDLTLVRALDEASDLARLKRISTWTSGNPLLLALDAPRVWLFLGDFIGVVYEYLNLLLLLDATGLYFAVRDLKSHGASLLRVTAAVGEIDTAISVASYRDGSGDWTRPRFEPDGALSAIDLRHPLVRDAVPNSIVMRPGAGVLVTGSNMSGKSTFLRTVGVNVILAQTLNTCMARDYGGPMFDVRSCIGRADDLIAGKSYYLVEVEALLGLVRVSEGAHRHLFLLDELFRGTNATERVAAGHGVLQELLESDCGRKPHVVIAATHDAELVGLLSAIYDAFHFGDAIGPDGLAFDHRLRRGPATTRTAVALLRQCGAPQRLLDRAAVTAHMLDRRLEP